VTLKNLAANYICFPVLPWQVTGLTNNSYFDGAHMVRHCVRKHPDLGRFVLQVAKVRTKNQIDELVKSCFHVHSIGQDP
jgi:hypothetical protein